MKSVPNEVEIIDIKAEIEDCKQADIGNFFSCRDFL